jgi:8-oxo-dGTP pyrophosphatase MutT (NUDIX family)
VGSGRPAAGRQAGRRPDADLSGRHGPDPGGQVSLPGGGLDAGESAETGALREAHEEVGLDPAAVEIAGSLSTLWVIVSRFVVQPVVAIAQTRPVFVPSPREVASLIEVPLARLEDPVTVRWGRRHRFGRSIACPFFAVDGPPVWGATAMMLGEFCSALQPGFGPPPAPAPPEIDQLPEIG